ncbi:MAG TPA: hypothetical protein VHC70_03305, partial [Phycisphaerales bacterium]|nr:hypothetical protein [Phycisphaerales bacterium]
MISMPITGTTRDVTLLLFGVASGGVIGAITGLVVVHDWGVVLLAGPVGLVAGAISTVFVWPLLRPTKLSQTLP